MKFGYFYDEAGNCHIQNEEAAVVRFVFTRYVNDHKPIDVLSYNLPVEVSPGILGGREWRRRHVHTILSDPNYAGVQATPKGLVSRLAGKHKLNLVGQPDELRQPMDVWFYSRIETTAERPTRRAEEKRITPALLSSASGELFAS